MELEQRNTGKTKNSAAPITLIALQATLPRAIGAADFLVLTRLRVRGTSHHQVILLVFLVTEPTTDAIPCRNKVADTG